MSERHQVLSSQVLLEGWASVKRVHFLQKRRDGTVQEQDRDLHNRGDGVTTLLYNREHASVLLLKQPRIVATLRGDAVGETLEACSGLLGDAEPHEGAKREIEEETGYIPLSLSHVASVFESPGGSLDLVHLFVAEYRKDLRSGDGGGIAQEGEDIEVLEYPLCVALDLMKEGRIRDARTMLLLQHLALTSWHLSAALPCGAAA